MRVDVTAEAAARALSLRMFQAMLATQEAFASYLGVKLGLYQVLHEHGPLTVDTLATTAGVAPRYAREWLEQQAVSGLITVDDPTVPWSQRSYRLPPGHARVLLPSDDPLSLVATALLPIGGVAGALPALLTAYRTGAGLAADVYGGDWRDGHAGANRAAYSHQLAGWLRMYLPAVHQRLSRPDARIADVGCGAGWASIALARAYPGARVTAVDIDAASVASAHHNIVAAGLRDRVVCRAGDAATVDGAGFDLVCLFDVVHELGRPVGVLEACRRLAGPSGTVLVLEARTADDFTVPGDDVERFLYATSVLHCLAAGLRDPGAVGTGTTMRAETMRGYARAAGFGQVRVHDLNDRLHRFYELVASPRGH